MRCHQSDKNSQIFLSTGFLEERRNRAVCRKQHPTRSDSKDKDINRGEMTALESSLRCKPLSLAVAGCQGPTSQAVRNVRSIARCTAQAVVEVTVVSGATVIETRGSIERAAPVVLDGTPRLGKELLQASTGRGARGTIFDHLCDLI